MYQVLQVMMIVILMVMVMVNQSEARDYGMQGEGGSYVTVMQNILEKEFLKGENINTTGLNDDIDINILGLI